MSKLCAVPPIVLGVFTGRRGKRVGGKAGVPEMFKSEGRVLIGGGVGLARRQTNEGLWKVVKSFFNNFVICLDRSRRGEEAVRKPLDHY